MMKSRDKRLKERGRGALMMVSRWLGAVAVIFPISAYSQGNLSSELLFTLLLVAVLWQVVLLRTGIRVQGSVLTVRGLLSDTKIPLQSYRPRSIRSICQSCNSAYRPVRDRVPLGGVAGYAHSTVRQW